MLKELSHQLPQAKLAYVNPGGNDYIQPRKLRLGIFTKIHSDGRKRENYILDVLPKIDPEVFEFFIMGDGWDAYFPVFRQFKFIVNWVPGFDEEVYKRWMPELDYFLYFGWDEGSMAWIDAVRAGVKTIATPQGYHLDVANGITHMIHDSSDLASVLLTIQDERLAYSDQTMSWTWWDYARQHAEIWRNILQKKEQHDYYRAF
jgi:hypothetical protein